MNKKEFKLWIESILSIRESVGKKYFYDVEKDKQINRLWNKILQQKLLIN